MKIEQFYEKCLSQASYYIEDNGIAVIVDPLRDIQQYLDLAEKNQARISYIFETHFHADFISGHLELARKTGAEIVFGPGANTEFDSYSAKDGEIFKIGSASIELLHTPGHTLESVCLLLRDSDQKELALFTGDTLFLGDVGRPDLAQSSDKQISSQDLAGKLYDSLREKILPIPGETIVYPGHGAGSACGKNMSKETSGTLAAQKTDNYALNTQLSREEFINLLCEGLDNPPAYFPENVKINASGYPNLDHLMDTGLRAMNPAAFLERSRRMGTLILDTRMPSAYAAGHISGAINIGLNGNFAPWAGELLQLSQREIIFLAEPGKEAEVVKRLARVGFHQVSGYLEGGIDEWINQGHEVCLIKEVDGDQLPAYVAEKNMGLIDVRKPSEYELGHVRDAVLLPLDQVYRSAERIDKEKVHLVYCAGGYRSMMFISILRSLGIFNLINVRGGFAAIPKDDAAAVSQ
ncbi:MBL fold metallo-hydrolase [Pedobacter zeae]|uniref:Glyoxylase-like metal-dependent hydrolase (Beta-lactamase superfamily II)/rhodanese-related sulfurtransferase n=1 Tax=Pedobacter zeae TaxID=1737356 RepID=A0A7W6P503_9SPHI|nr:MBL fold metallo-hydrolase [Pedobacter zeae]MBB4107542.1 glyoxylase-like metal-dependent hydrolase (beta-lactamase superfamily II)/rhodanese-related sulfurtransferase [Pedobacter zeae]GGG98645.1 MBL fold metallo-hydrolase [Pedobacter zeae]